MQSKVISKLLQVLSSLGYFIIWLGLMALAALVVYQCFSTVLIGGVWLNESPYRPRYWSSFRLKWLGRFMVLILGGAYIFFLSLLVNLLTEWQQQNRLIKNALRMAGILLTILAILFAIAQLFVLRI